MDRNLAEWFASRDTGLSSKAIALYLSAGVNTGNVPHDSADFGRCYRLLKHMGWENRISEMANASGRWAVLVEIWPALVAAYEAEDHNEVYRLIGCVEAEGFQRDGYRVEVGEDGRMRSAFKKDGASSFRMGGVSVSVGP